MKTDDGAGARKPEWMVSVTLFPGTVHENVSLHFFETEEFARKAYVSNGTDVIARLCRIVEVAERGEVGSGDPNVDAAIKASDKFIAEHPGVPIVEVGSVPEPKIIGEGKLNCPCGSVHVDLDQFPEVGSVGQGGRVWSVPLQRWATRAIEVQPEAGAVTHKFRSDKARCMNCGKVDNLHSSQGDCPVAPSVEELAAKAQDVLDCFECVDTNRGDLIDAVNALRRCMNRGKK